MPENLVLLHGFAGTRHTWDSVLQRLASERYTPLAFDLPGHGEATDTPMPITFAACVEHVLANSPARFVLCGYSMGGRVGLHVALAAPERVSRLVLISCTAGLAKEGDRVARVAADNALARDLEERSFTEFMDRWQAQPIFADDPPEVHAAMRAEQQRNNPRALAAVLRGIGTGTMTPLWDRLSELQIPVTVLVGERDLKLHAPARRMVEKLPDGKLRMLPGGHRLPLENPQCVADALRSMSPTHSSKRP
ncbi:MAG TPA: alpha/beta fold hydrolase [Solirubrobacteraceae bacterium]|nr:alpha/beta fold hydrolase [Solirubrobacteraceae bacterium]